MTEEELAAQVAAIEGQFRLWTGDIDLLGMSACLCEQHFRQYISISRILRQIRRQTSPSPS